MPKFVVSKFQDAYVRYETTVEAKDGFEAFKIASSRSYKGKWNYSGEVLEYQDTDFFAEEVRPADEDDTIDPAHREYVRLDVTRAELNTILAALRNWQQTMDRCEPSPMLTDIATNGGEHGLMPAEEIDGLCERINR